MEMCVDTEEIVMGRDNSEQGAAEVFRTLLGNLTEEQWENYRALKRQQGNLVCDDTSSSDSSIDNSEDEQPMETDDLSATTASAKVSSSDKSLQADFTVKYINGEITFTEFTDFMDKESPPQTINVDIVIDPAKPGTMTIKEVTTEKKDKSDIEDFDPIAEKKKLKKVRRKNRLPKDLEGLMGEANLCFARGDHEDAVKMCMEVIRQAPRAPEPFTTLGMIYEDMGDMAKSLQFFLIGAYLQPNNPEEWSKLAEMSLEQGNVSQAITCFTKAIKYDPKNVDLHLELCTLYEQTGNQKKAIECCESVLQLLGPDQGEQCLHLSREIAKVHHKNGSIAASIQVMERAFQKFPSHIISEDVNMLLELQFAEKHFSDAVMILHKHCGVDYELVSDCSSEVLTLLEKGELSDISKCSVPDVLPIDLKVKLIMGLIQMGGFHLVADLGTYLKKENPEEMGDLFLDVAEAYMDKEKYDDAISYLDILIKTKNYNLAAVWLRYGECLHKLSRIDEAINAYKRVTELAPSHLDAKLTLSSLLIQQGHMKEAILTLKQEYENGNSETALDMPVLIKRAYLMYSEKDWESFIMTAKLLLECHSARLEAGTEFEAVFVNLSFRGRKDGLQEVRKTHGLSSRTPLVTDSVTPNEDLWDLYMKLCHVLYSQKHGTELQYVTTIALLSNPLNRSPELTQQLEFHALLAHYRDSKKEKESYYLARAFVLKHMKSNRAWNIFNIAVCSSPAVRHNRFCLRLLYKHPESVPLALLNGHNALIASTHKQALAEYMLLYREDPTNPFYAFCVALAFMHISVQKFCSNKFHMYLQASSFFNRYMELRGRCQESLYNVARAMHHLGFFSIAVQFYKEALEKPSVVDGDNEIFDLTKEIVFNLTRIYQTSGNMDLVTYYIEKYCVI